MRFALGPTLVGWPMNWLRFAKQPSPLGLVIPTAFDQAQFVFAKYTY
jgi:hypothetical protein